MPKKQSRNAFWFFMAEWKTLQERNGRVFPNGFRDVQADPECNEAWRALTPAQKAPYTTKAKNAKAEPSMGRQTGTGEFIHLIKEEEQRQQDFQQNMEAHIRMTITDAKRYKTLPTLVFPFIHMNIYYMRQPDNEPVDYCPAEFAIGEFSLENGISRYYHEIIKTVPHLGYTRDAMETSEKTHKLVWDLPNGEGDWAIIYYKMMTFLEPLMINDELPPIYTLKKYMHYMPSLFRRMTEAVGQGPEKFVVYSLEALFGNMLRAVTEHPESNIVSILADTQLGKELFAYTPNIECAYHKQLDGTSQFCSLSVIRQWAYEFCDQCCKPLRVDMIPGIHFPEPLDTGFVKSEYGGSMQSLASNSTVGVLSATGVSEQYRIAVSERSRDEEARRRRQGNGHVEIINHAHFKEEELPPVPEPPPVAPVPNPPSAAVQISTRPQRHPSTASQALIGVSRAPPIFSEENFPAIGGRGFPMRPVDNNRMVGSTWAHREFLQDRKRGSGDASGK